MSAELLKVLYCSFDVLPEPTGTSARATDFIRGLAPLYNADGLTAKSPDHPHIERFYGMRLMRVPVGSGDLPVRAQAFERAVRRQLESDEYQLVHFTDPYGGYALCELRAQYNFKLLYEVVGFPSVEVKYTHPQLEGDRRFMSKLRRQELFCLMNADAVLVGSEQTAAMVQGLGVSRERITVIPACADVSHYLPIDQLAPPDRTPMRLLYLGSQHAWQGLSTLLFAMSIASQLAEVRLAIVGPQHPTSRLQLEEMVKYRKLTGLVDFLDPVPHDELAKVLSAADVGVAPLEKSDRNTMQGAPVTKIAHYLAAGRPVIASDLPIAREISNDACALFHAPGDENDLAEKIVALARDPARRVAMGERAHAFARERLHADNARTALLRLYSTLLGAAASPDAPQPEEGSYAPTSVGVAALPEREESTQTAIDVGVSLTGPSIDPYRGRGAPASATLEAAPVAPESTDGSATPRGVQSFTGPAAEAPPAPVSPEASVEGSPQAPAASGVAAASSPAGADAGGPSAESAEAPLAAAAPAPRLDDPYEFDLSALPVVASPPSEESLPAAGPTEPAPEEEPPPAEAETVMLGGEPESAPPDGGALPLEGPAPESTPSLPEPVPSLAATSPLASEAPATAAEEAQPILGGISEPPGPELDGAPTPVALSIDVASVDESPKDALPASASAAEPSGESPVVVDEAPATPGEPAEPVRADSGALPWDAEPNGEEQRLEAVRSVEAASSGTAPEEVPLDEVFEVEELPSRPSPAPSATAVPPPPSVSALIATLPLVGQAVPPPALAAAPRPPLTPLGRQASEPMPFARSVAGALPPVARPFPPSAPVPGVPGGGRQLTPPPPPAAPRSPVPSPPAPARARAAMPPPKVSPPVLSPARPPPPRLEPIARQKTGGLPIVGSAGAPPVLYPAARPPASPTPVSRAAAGPGVGAPGLNSADAPEEIDVAEVEALPEEPSRTPMTPASGLSPSDEWLGHVLLGYAPFAVPVPRRSTTGETPVLDLAARPEGPGNPRR